MKAFKIIAISVSVLFAWVLLAGIYRFNFTHDDIYIEMGDGRVLRHDEAVTSAAHLEKKNATLRRDDILAADIDKSALVMRKLFSLKTSAPFNVNLPNSQMGVPLTYFIGKSNTEGKQTNNELVVGDYQYDEVKGKILLDYYKITPLNGLPVSANAYQKRETDLFTFLAPFAVTTQETGVFWYLGLFSIDYRTSTLSHLKSEFIGDRVEIKSIEFKEPFDSPYSVSVTYKVRSANQAMSDAPTETNTILLTVSETAMTKIGK
ncbi:hypothetical protein HWQ46_01340 [Shewanella sp. D64]|uniref:hypothetical protein n=1 Tax=unclassified Shewanella TaxID=196818 RepID=UPI0022BA6408|nr:MULTISPECIES: hypothetical protein [unclassified Shewanella]MEC4724194.1 hypothetical protein [Shewanella sp. D64]MEC4736214.1 hypothetical protein [Shewanella sp. E94]WBJ97853.1 hypothetical protein HWQ47_12515 [Shewanella sp. MTB7]